MQADPDDIEFPLNAVRDSLLEVLAQPTGGDEGFLTAIRDDPDELTNWGAYSDWLQDRDLPPAGLFLLDRALRVETRWVGEASRAPALDSVKVTGHVAQVCMHVSRSEGSPTPDVTPDDHFEHFTAFDDRWAAAHPTLAAGILTFGSRWDVLV